MNGGANRNRGTTFVVEAVATEMSVASANTEKPTSEDLAIQPV